MLLFATINLIAHICANAAAAGDMERRGGVILMRHEGADNTHQTHGAYAAPFGPTADAASISKMEEGTMRCMAPVSLKNKSGSSGRFSNVRVLEIGPETDAASIKRSLQTAQSSGQPVLLRTKNSKTPAAMLETMLDDTARYERLKSLVGDQQIKIKDGFEMKRFEPNLMTWAGMRDATSLDILNVGTRLATAFNGKEPDAVSIRYNGTQASLAESESLGGGANAHERITVDHKKKPTSGSSFTARLGNMIEAVRRNLTDGFYFHVMLRKDKHASLVSTLAGSGLLAGAWPKDRGYSNWKPDSNGWPDEVRYPVFRGDEIDYEVLFIQPTGIGGTHIDDLDVTTYFYLRLLAGRKRIRLWPFFEHGELESWGCSQRHWALNTTPPELFLRGTYQKGWRAEHWTSKGFEYGPLNTVVEPNFSWNQFCRRLTMTTPSWRNLHKGHCFVEVELMAGEEIFVPSGIPHQVTTLEPSVAISGNYRFSTFGDLRADKLVRLLRDTNMLPSSLHWAGLSSRLQMMQKVYRGARKSMEDAREDILNSQHFRFDRWLKYAKKHHPRGWLPNTMSDMLNSSNTTHPEGVSPYEASRLVTAVLLATMQEERDAISPYEALTAYNDLFPTSAVLVLFMLGFVSFYTFSKFDEYRAQFSRKTNLGQRKVRHKQ